MDRDCIDCAPDDDDRAADEREWQAELDALTVEQHAPSPNGDTPDARHIDGLDVFAFLDTPEPEYDWTVPSLLERMDRVFLTGGEGDGKSTLIRQFAVKSTAGIHPFDDTTIEPLRVLLVDFENTGRQVRRALRALTVSAGDRLEPGRLTVTIKPEGIDLLRAEDKAWLDSEVEAAAPLDVLCIGPLYKMASGNPLAEEVARPVSRVLDELRVHHNLAIILEGHTPYSAGGGAKRPERPYGASLWSRWPEFGLHLGSDGALRHWRGPREERAWPTALTRGGDWPWTVETDQRAINFARILETVTTAGKRLSVRELALATGIPKSTVERAIDANRDQWDATLKGLEP